MRLTKKQLETICKNFNSLFFAGDTLWLFGSRTDDSKRGGDIDLYIETNQKNPDLVYEQHSKLSNNIQKEIGEQKIDIVINILSRDLQLLVYKEALKNGILLMKKETPLAHHIKTADLHAKRLQYAVKKVHKKYPSIPGFLTDLDDKDIEPFDMMNIRFIKLQDLIGSKIFSEILEIRGEEAITLIDKLNRLDKLEYLDDVNWWENLRKFRNRLTHEYQDDDALVAKTIKELLHESEKLLEYWQKLKSKLQPLL
jgi:uncharacterized protein with HEPN domain